MKNGRMENERMSDSMPGVDEADVSVARMVLDEPLSVQQVDLPDFFPALFRQAEIDVAIKRHYDS